MKKLLCCYVQKWIKYFYKAVYSNQIKRIKQYFLSGGGGFTRPIFWDAGADQLRGVPIIGKPPKMTRGLEW